MPPTRVQDVGKLVDSCAGKRSLAWATVYGLSPSRTGDKIYRAQPRWHAWLPGPAAFGEQLGPKLT